jgi:hypothetical protein
MCFRSNKDDAGRQLDPAEIASGTAIQTPGNAPELGEKSMATLHGATDAADARLPGAATLGRLHPKASRVGAGVAGTVAIGTIGTSTRQIPWVRVIHGRCGGWRLHDHRCQDRLRLNAIIGPRLGDNDAQRQAVFLGR